MRTTILSLVTLLLTTSSALAQEPARVTINIKVPADTPSFANRRLVITLYHDFPGQDDRGLRTVDRYVDAKFSHQKGKNTLLSVTLGQNAKSNQGVRYSVNAAIFTPQSKQTHFAEFDGRPAPLPVLTFGAPSKLSLVLNPAR